MMMKGWKSIRPEIVYFQQNFFFLLENQPGELLVEKDTVMAEAADRANRARNVLRQQEQSAG